MNNLLRLCVLAGLAMNSLVAVAQPLPRGQPEEEGISASALLDFVNALDQQVEGIHAVMVVRHGKVVAEGWWRPYDANHNHVLYSLSKSFTSTAVGLTVAEGKLSVDDEVLKFFPDDAPAEPSNNLKAMRVRDLLMMSSGHQDEPSAAPDVISPKTFLAQPVPHLPGTHFKYNTAATFMQSAIVQKVTGQTTLDYLRARLFEPLGISNPVWDTNFQGISLGGYGLRVRTEDIAKFGQLYLQKGQWKGKQLIPASWIEMATTRQTSNGSNPKSDWSQGYGFQFWRCRHNAFRGDGAFGQFCVVMPEQDTVVAINSGTKDLQIPLNVIWDKLLPALQPKPVKKHNDAKRRLEARLQELEIRPAQGAATSPLATKVLNRKYAFPVNDEKVESLTLSSQDGDKTLILHVWMEGKELVIPCGYHDWRTGRGFLPGPRMGQFADEPIAGTFGWEPEETCQVKFCACETPFHVVMKLKFEGDEVRLDSEMNVGFGATKRATLKGKGN
jgi:CubicO group peptidase (beta-lactamase class C family)